MQGYLNWNDLVKVHERYLLILGFLHFIWFQVQVYFKKKEWGMGQDYSSVAQSLLQNSHEGFHTQHCIKMCVCTFIFIYKTPKNIIHFKMINFIMKSSPQTHTRTHSWGNGLVGKVLAMQVWGPEFGSQSPNKTSSRIECTYLQRETWEIPGGFWTENPTVQSSRFHFRPCSATTCIHTHINIHTHLSKSNNLVIQGKKAPQNNKTDVGERGIGG